MTRIDGFKEFSDELEEFADELEQIEDELDRAIDRGVSRTAHSVERTSKQLAPSDDGELRADLQATKLEMALWSVGSTKKYAPPTEYGSDPHPITPNGPYPLRFYWERKGRWVSTYEVNHPGTPAQPFLRPALNRHRSDLVDNIVDEIEKLIDAELR